MKKDNDKLSYIIITDLKDQGLTINRNNVNHALSITSDSNNKTGTIRCEGKIIAEWKYNKKAGKYVADHKHSTYPHGRKRIIADTPEEIEKYILFRINRFSS